VGSALKEASLPGRFEAPPRSQEETAPNGVRLVPVAHDAAPEMDVSVVQHAEPVQSALVVAEAAGVAFVESAEQPQEVADRH